MRHARLQCEVRQVDSDMCLVSVVQAHGVEGGNGRAAGVRLCRKWEEEAVRDVSANQGGGEEVVGQKSVDCRSAHSHGGVAGNQCEGCCEWRDYREQEAGLFVWQNRVDGSVCQWRGQEVEQGGCEGGITCDEAPWD